MRSSSSVLGPDHENQIMESTPSLPVSDEFTVCNDCLGSAVAVGSIVFPGVLLNMEWLRSSVTVARPTEMFDEAVDARMAEELDGETEIELSENKWN